MKQYTLFLLLFIAAISAGHRASAQEIQLDLTVTKDALSPSVRDRLIEFDGHIRKYIEEFRWTSIEFHQDLIPVSIQINFTSGTESGEFTAQIAVFSSRRLYVDGRKTDNSTLIFKIMDPNWSFLYNKDIPLTHNEYQFSEVGSLLDFYMYFIVGLDFDSMEPLQGTPYYQKALIAAQRSQNSSRANEWRGSINQYSRMNLISEILNAKMESYRLALYWYYYEGLDFITTEPEPAKQSIVKALQFVTKTMTESTSQSILLTQWLEGNAGQFCPNLDGYPDRKLVMQQLEQADPPRAEVYRACGL